MRYLVPFLLICLFDWYAFQAFEVIAANWSESEQLLLCSVYWSIPIIATIVILNTLTGRTANWNQRYLHLLRAFLMIAYFSKLFIVAVLLLEDISRLLLYLFDAIFGNQSLELARSVTMAKMAIGIGTIPFVTLIYGMFRNPYRYKVFSETVEIDNLPEAIDGLKIVQISDIHSGSFKAKEPVRNAIEMINQQQADLVFFTGDLVNSVAHEMEQFMDVFDKIQAKYGVFSILGNHDYGEYVRWSSEEAKQHNFEQLIKTHQELGWDLMRNENRILNINGENVAIIGVENFSASPRFQQYGDLERAYEGTENSILKLLLSHDPTHWTYEVTKSFQDIAITFSGHTHGMQFGLEIAKWFKWSPSKYVYKEWAGLYQEGEQYLYVNRGLGFLAYPGRVGILPEITVIHLKKK